MANNFFSDSQQKLITDAIAKAELDTSGEIRVHIESRCKEDVLDRAAFIFKELEMHKTERRNGVLFYVSHEDRKFAILGDGGINAKVPENFWNNIKEQLLVRFKKGDYAEGLSEGIIEAGKQLKAHFPLQSDDVNELSNQISYGDNMNKS